MIEFTPGDQRGHRILLTPGPLTTTRSVREAMLDDIGSWDTDCIDLVREIRDRVIALTGDPKGLTCTLMQGNGSMGVEAMIGSFVPRNGKLLVLVNGAYGRRIATMASVLGIPFVEMVDPEDRPHDPARVDAILARDPAITDVVVVHCETTTGLLNPLREIGLVVQRHGKRFLVDAISSFGAYEIGPGKPMDFAAGPIQHLAVSSNKCIEGVPGFSFIISRREAMEASKGIARSCALDVYDQWQAFEKTGKFRFTPPTHVLLAFAQALRELEREGGIPARQRRYADNHRVLVEGLARLGFRSLIAPEHQGHIITTFVIEHAGFSFDRFYEGLRRRGYIIYPGKLTTAETFRIGNIGSIARQEIDGLLVAIGEVLAEEKIASPVASKA